MFSYTLEKEAYGIETGSPRDEIETVNIVHNQCITSHKAGVLDFNLWVENIYGEEEFEKFLHTPKCDHGIIIRDYLRYVREQEIE